MTGSGNSVRPAASPGRAATHGLRGRSATGRPALDRSTFVRSGSRTRRLLLGLVAAAVLVVLAWLRLGWEPALLPAAYLALVTAPLFSVDVAEHRLPNRLVLPGYPFALAAVALAWVRDGHLPIVALVAGAAYFVFLLLLNLAGGMGMGDVKLAGVLGLGLGLVSVEAAVAGILLAFLLGGAAGLALTVIARSGPTARIPFGPFLLAGFWASVALALGR